MAEIVPSPTNRQPQARDSSLSPSTSTFTLRICTLIRENSCCRVWGRPSCSDFFSSRRLLGGSSFKTSRRERVTCWKRFLKWIQRAVLGYLPQLGDAERGTTPKTVWPITFFLPVAGVVLVICILSVKGLLWFRQKSNALNELINTI